MPKDSDLTVGELKEYIKDIPDNKTILIGNWEGHGDINDHIIVDIHKVDVNYKCDVWTWGLRIVIRLTKPY